MPRQSKKRKRDSEKLVKAREALKRKKEEDEHSAHVKDDEATSSDTLSSASKRKLLMTGTEMDMCGEEKEFVLLDKSYL